MPLSSFPILYQSSRRFAASLGRPLVWSSFRLYSSSNQPTSTPTPTPSSTSKNLTEEEAKSRASELLSYLPGSTPLAKTTWLTVGGSLAAVLAANDVYIPNHETPVLAAFVVLMRIFYVKLGPMISEFAGKGIQELRTLWTNRLQGERQGYLDALDYLSKFKSYRQVSQAYVSTRKENVALEAELDSCLQTNKYLHDAKMAIEERVRAANEARLSEKRALLTSLLDRVMADLKDPKIQESIMRQCLVDIDSIATTAQAKK